MPKQVEWIELGNDIEALTVLMFHPVKETEIVDIEVAEVVVEVVVVLLNSGVVEELGSS